MDTILLLLENHETPPWEISISGPQDRWPTRSGFEKFYGFIGGETNQWAPLIYDGVTLVETPDDPNYHFTTDMTNQAISWARYQQALSPDKPFFMYFAPGATHAPHHVPKKWIEKYKGKFDQGWDKIRELTLERRKNWALFPRTQSLHQNQKILKTGINFQPMKRNCLHARWKFMPDLLNRLITKLEDSFQLLKN